MSSEGRIRIADESVNGLNRTAITVASMCFCYAMTCQRMQKK